MQIDQLNQYFFDRFRFKVEKTRLKTYNKNEWRKFCKTNGLVNVDEMYCLNNFTAHVSSCAEYFQQNLYHAYFGHGLFCEHSSLMKTEQFNNEVLDMAEGFALWTEYYFSMLNNELEMFNQKVLRMNKKERLLLDKFRLYESKYSDYSLVYSCGLPKHYDKKTLESILCKLFDKNSVKFALLYGSRKPYSDIDIFMVSDYSPLFLGWIDVYSVDNEKFNHMVEMLDIFVTEALFTGTFIIGDNDYYENVKFKVQNSKISDKQIRFNIEQARMAEQLAKKQLYNSQLYKQYLSYKLSYLANAKLLRENKKALTLKNLFTC